jgi:hypothetical protein
MHLFMPDDQIGPKIVGLTPADMASLHGNKKYFFSSKQPSLTAVTTPTLNLSCFTRKTVCFY